MAVISVVMPVYNTPVPYLKEAVGSILGQTFRDFELIIVDDGSENETEEYLRTLSDPRIRMIRNETNRGITRSLNIGFAAARGKYIARMDGDDISFPERFEKQFAFMESHPDVFVCGADSVNLGDEPRPVSTVMEDMESYRVRMLFAYPGPTHPTAFFSREKLDRYRITYDESLVYAQDYGMWRTISKVGRICILPEVLLYYRIHPDQINKKHREQQIRCDKMTQRKLLTELLGDISDEELDMHYRCSTGFYRDAVISPQVHGWYRRILRANSDKKIYDQAKKKKRIILIEKKLIEHRYTKSMSMCGKALLLFRYLPAAAALKTVTDVMRSRTRRRSG